MAKGRSKKLPAHLQPYERNWYGWHFISSFVPALHPAAKRLLIQLISTDLRRRGEPVDPQLGDDRDLQALRVHGDRYDASRWQ